MMASPHPRPQFSRSLPPAERLIYALNSSSSSASNNPGGGPAVEWSASEACPGTPRNCAANLLDSDPSTVWHCFYSTGCWVDFDLGSAAVVTSLTLVRSPGEVRRFVKATVMSKRTADAGWSTVMTIPTITSTDTVVTITVPATIATYIMLREIVSTDGHPGLAGVTFAGPGLSRT